MIMKRVKYMILSDYGSSTIFFRITYTTSGDIRTSDTSDPVSIFSFSEGSGRFVTTQARGN
jgi:hypothetical protein